MIRYSVIIPQRDAADAVRRQLPALTTALAQLDGPFEIVVVDDASAMATLRLLEKLQVGCSMLRIVRLSNPCGVSVAIAAGIAAARGEVLLAMAAGETYPAGQIPWMVRWLGRADFVAGRRRTSGFTKLWQRVARIPRSLLMGTAVHDLDCLFWLARREAVIDLPLPRGMARYLPALVARRGFRVCDAYVEHVGPRQRLDDVRPNPADLLTAWWLCRRWREANASEMRPGDVAGESDSTATLRLHDAQPKLSAPTVRKVRSA